MNSLWGRFGLNPDKLKIEFLHDWDEYHDLMTNDEFEVTAVEVIDPKTMFVAYKEREEYREPNARGNVIIAAFVAMWARLELYKELEKLGERALYMDTDSII